MVYDVMGFLLGTDHSLSVPLCFLHLTYEKRSMLSGTKLHLEEGQMNFPTKDFLNLASEKKAKDFEVFLTIWIKKQAKLAHFYVFGVEFPQFGLHWFGELFLHSRYTSAWRKEKRRTKTKLQKRKLNRIINDWKINSLKFEVLCSWIFYPIFINQKIKTQKNKTEDKNVKWRNREKKENSGKAENTER